MPPKPSSGPSSKDADEAVMAISEKMGLLQSQITNLQQLQDTRHDSLLAMMQTLLEQFSNLTPSQIHCLRLRSSLHEQFLERAF